MATTLSKLANKVRCSSVYGARKPHDKQDEWQQNANGYTVTLRYKGRQMTTDFWMGSAITTEPDAASVLSCLLSDASAGSETFEDWCANLGYDTDSRKAERIYKQCLEQTAKLKKLLGEDFEGFLYAENDV